DRSKVWNVLKNGKIYKSNTNEVNDLINNIKNLQILEIVSKDVKRYKEYSLDEESANKIKIFVKKNKKIIPFTVFIGKQGGFSYNEFYVRFEDKPYIYLAKGIENRWVLERPFYDYCDKSILISEIGEISYVEFKYNNKVFQYKKTLKDSTTIWFCLENKKEVEENKIEEFTKNFVADKILLDEEIINEKLKVLLEIKIIYKNSEVQILIYNKESVKEEIFSFYPIKIKCFNLDSQSIKFCGREDIYYAIAEYRYNKIVDFLKINLF
ncbi:MAG: DUF4340 domain-containing protein, partial [Endomicrobiia bacterium]